MAQPEIGIGALVMSDQDLMNQVNSIVDSLENPPLHCSECECECDDDSCKDCGADTAPMGAFDYAMDVLDIEYTVSSSGEYLGARLLVCFGGPNIWIDTRHNRVEGGWWADSHWAGYDDEMGLDECMRDLYECR